VLTSGIVDVENLSTAGGRRLVQLLVLCPLRGWGSGSTVWNERAVGGAGPGKPGGTLLGPEESGAGTWMGVWLLVFLWLFGCWIVDASIFVAVLLKAFRPSFLWGGLGVLFLLCLCVWRQAMKGVWWMPWHQEPMKDVGACDKPWGVGNRAVIRGCPNGETWLESCPVTCT
jgi:hypothetical protein